jgi:hypothetical protein
VASMRLFAPYGTLAACAAARTSKMPGGPVVAPAAEREAAPMLTPKVTELTRAGSTWVLLPNKVSPVSKRPAAVSLPAGR